MTPHTQNDLHAVLFAGGVGQRLWPLSRRNSPKQFMPLVEARSSIALAVERLNALVPSENIYVSTNERYAGILAEQLPHVPQNNFILEPTRRDLAAAVALAFFTLEKKGIAGPVIFQWSDHYTKNTEVLLNAFSAGVQLIRDNPERIVVIAQKPTYANDHLGWIERGAERGVVNNVPYHSFGEWTYRPTPEVCTKIFNAGTHVWNTGQFVSSVTFITNTFRVLAPELSATIEKIIAENDTTPYTALPPLTFDAVFLERVPREQALLITDDMGFTDPGNLYSLKEMLETVRGETVTRGAVVDFKTNDNFLSNDTDRPLVVMGTSNLIVVQLPDVTFVVDKTSVPHMSTLLAELEARGLGHLL